MRLIISAVFAVAALAGSAAVAKDYSYRAPDAPAATAALQTPAKAPQKPEAVKKVSLTALDSTPGQVRQASRIAEWQSRDDDHAGYACVDDKCKNRTPVYNTRTPLQQEQGRLGTN